MSDIFISYARSTAAKALQVAEALRALGYGVWRDDEIPAHRAYADVIQERLRAAKAVLVIWSQDAAKSEWVRSEAERARSDHKLVQLTIDNAELPMPFDQIQCADLAGWAGEADAPGWKKVVGSISALAGAGKGGEAQSAAGPAAARRHSICVLPFANMSDDPQQEYFSDGISEDIITDLSKVSSLFVVARNTAFTLKAKAVDVAQVARQLNVSHVLEGSVRKAGNRVRITAQLIDGVTGGHVWAERYDRDLTDIFALQDEISEAIVMALKLKLLPEEKAAIEQRGTSSPDAYNLYLMARQYWVSGNIGDIRREEAIISLCLRATEIDPAYARAWALVALAQTQLRFVHSKPGDDGLAAAERALSLDPELAEAHAVKARHLAEQGRQDEAFAEVQAALGLDPDSYEVNQCAGELSVRQRRLEDAIRYYERAVELMETDFRSPGMLITCYHAIEDADAERRAAQITLERGKKALAQDQSNGSAIGFIVSALLSLGEAERAKEWMARALLIDPGNLNMRYNFACNVSAHLQDADGAIDLLEPLFAGTAKFYLDYAKSDPDLDPVREHPRFKAMLAAAEARVAEAEAAGASSSAA